MSFLNRFVVATLPFVPKSIVGLVSRRYIAGDSLAEAVRHITALNRLGITTTTDLLGEYITQLQEATRNREQIEEVFGAIRDHNLRSTVSIKLSQMGLILDREECFQNVLELADLCRRQGNRMTLDMEDSSTVDATLDIAERLKREGFTNVGIVSQAYLRRAADDVSAWIKSGGGEVRLCKGIYVEPESVAFKSRDEIRTNFLRLFNRLIEAGCFVGIATHDDMLVRETHDIIRAKSLAPSAYEYQMLLGVREDLRDWIRSQSHPLRIYVPFGKHWYAYSVRRLRENPDLAGHVFKAMFTGRTTLRHRFSVH